MNEKNIFALFFKYRKRLVSISMIISAILFIITALKFGNPIIPTPVPILVVLSGLCGMVFGLFMFAAVAGFAEICHQNKLKRYNYYLS
jgi:hypothetical protein